MKKLFLFAFLAFLSMNVSGQNSSPLEMTDGYFQASNGGRPVHLVHPAPYPPQWVYLDEHVRIWYEIALRKGEQSPCNTRSKTQCIQRIGFFSLADPKYSFFVDASFAMGDQISTSYSIPIDREKTPLGVGKFVFTVQKDGKTLFSHEILVEVK